MSFLSCSRKDDAKYSSLPISSQVAFDPSTQTVKRFLRLTSDNMTSRELLVVILNHTNEELDLEPDSPSLQHGHWMDTTDSLPPAQILAGESGMLRCKSSHVGAGVSGSVTYRVVGYEESYKVTFLWNVPYVGQNKFDSLCAAEGFAVRMLGGRGNQAVAVFVFEPAESQRTDVNVGTAVIKGPVKCAEAPLGSFH